MSVLAAIQAITTDSAQLATDQGAVTAAQNALAAAQAVVANDTSTVTAADNDLSTALQGTPGAATVDTTNNVVTIYQWSSATPGYTITTMPIAS